MSTTRKPPGRPRSGRGDKPRVMVVTPVFPPARGGIETLTEGIVDGLGTAVTDVVTLDEPGAAEWALGSPLPVHRAANSPRGGRRALIRLNALMVLRGVLTRPTVVLNMHVRTAVGAQILRRVVGARWVQYYHAKEIPIFDRSAGRAARHADAHVAVSSYTAGLVEAAGARPEDVHVIPPAAPTDLSALEHRDRTGAGGPVLLTVSRLADEYKGHDVVLAALPRILRAVPDATWIVAGDGILRERLTAEAARTGLSDHVRFLGPVTNEERDDLLTGSDVFILPSRVPAGGRGGEGFGIVYIEAAAAGLPVLAGNVGGSVDAVEDADTHPGAGTGLLVDATSAEAVADGVIRLLTDPDLVARLRARGPAWAASFTWDRLLGDLNPLLLDPVPHHSGVELTTP